MPWTESRTRDEWLAEVRRRGDRIRRRRRWAISAVGMLAFLLPLLALASQTGNPDRQLQVTAPGPASAGAGAGAGGGPPAAMATTAPGIASETPPVETGAASPAEPRPTAEPVPSTTAEVHRRPGAVNPAPAAEPEPEPAGNDDPVVSSTTPTTDGRGSASSGTAAPAPPAPVTPADDPPLAACPAADVVVTVSIDRATYAPGETVSWSSTIENRSATTCLMSRRAFFHVEDNAGRIVSSFAYTADFQYPVKAEPGTTFSSGLTWDQTDCSGETCVQASPGTYVVVAGWTEGGPYVGRGSFQIGS